MKKLISPRSNRKMMRGALAATLIICAPASANACMNANAARAAISDGNAASLSQVRNSVMKQLSGEVVKAQLCEQSSRLVYILSVLQSSGSVKQVVADAASGKILEVR